VTHRPGFNEDYLVFRTPLRGDFEVSCRLRRQGWTEAHVRYGTLQFDLGHDLKQYRLHTTARHDAPHVTITPPLPPAKDNTYQLTTAVKDGWFRVSVDGREVAAERLGPDPDPWLMLHAYHTNTADIRDFKLTGRPTVPDRVDLLAGADLGMWRAYLGTIAGGESRNQGGNFWTKRGEEAFEFGRKPEVPEGKPARPRGFPESLIQYARPFLEDGAVEYDFFYDPDKAAAHPALDRLAFLLEPDGVKLHWVTDGPADKSGTPVDNAKDEPGCRRGPAKLPLKPKAWNRVRLAVAGDVVTVAVNGEAVYERPIEPTNQRLFGLFHYTDRTEARVRGVTLTGDWPRQVPAAEKLFEKK
jgi:hypothetical protein